MTSVREEQFNLEAVRPLICGFIQLKGIVPACSKRIAVPVHTSHEVISEASLVFTIFATDRASVYRLLYPCRFLHSPRVLCVRLSAWRNLGGNYDSVDRGEPCLKCGSHSHGLQCALLIEGHGRQSLDFDGTKHKNKLSGNYKSSIYAKWFGSREA